MRVHSVFVPALCILLTTGVIRMGVVAARDNSTSRIEVRKPAPADRFSRAFEAHSQKTPADAESPGGEPIWIQPVIEIGAADRRDVGITPHSLPASYRPHGVPDGFDFRAGVPAMSVELGLAPYYRGYYFGPDSTASVGTAGRPLLPQAVQTDLEELAHEPRLAPAMKAGFACFRDRDYLAAATWFRQAIPLEPDEGLPRFAFAWSLFALGDYGGAMYSLRRGLDLLPDYASSGQDLRALYGEMRDFEDQRMALASTVRIDPKDREARALLGCVLFFSGDLDGADAALRPLLGKDGDDADPLPAHFLATIEAIRKHSR